MNIMTKQGSLDNVITYEHYCDTVADLQNIPKSQITLGSVAIVVNGESDGIEIYIADSHKQWTELTSMSGSGEIDPEAIAEAVENWLNEHPEATTTVQDGSITRAKLNSDLQDAVDEIPDLKSALPQTYVALNGENQVQPQNIAGVTFTKGEGEVLGVDIFSETYLGENGFYASVNTSVTPPVLAHATVSTLRWYAIPVDAESKYQFTKARFACLAKGNTIRSEAIGTTLSNVSEVTTTGDTAFLILSYSSSVSEVEVRKVTTGIVYSNFVMPDWMQIDTSDKKPKNASVTGNISSGGNLQIPTTRNNLRKGERIVFEGNITSFEALKIGLSFTASVGTDSNQMNTFLVDDTNISYYATSNSSPVTVPHGLTLTNNIQIIWEMSETATCKFTLISNGELFEHEFTSFVRRIIGNPYVLSVNTALTDCKLSWTCIDLNKNIWMFGDSYFGYSANRWTYYLHEYGYDKNCLLDGFPGEGSTNARVSFSNLLEFGTPKFVVWCMGMNDTSDTESAPATNWITGRDSFLQYCQDNNITPIFGTIPTVPTINHEQKNAWIRSSGYRYIDFAKAVGATSSGTWFSGMLSSDGIHPTEQGARALFARALLDLPEIMVDDFDY